MAILFIVFSLTEVFINQENLYINTLWRLQCLMCIFSIDKHFYEAKSLIYCVMYFSNASTIFLDTFLFIYKGYPSLYICFGNIAHYDGMKRKVTSPSILLSIIEVAFFCNTRPLKVKYAQRAMTVFHHSKTVNHPFPCGIVKWFQNVFHNFICNLIYCYNII